MVAWMRNGRGWYCVAVLILGQLGCARSSVLPPPAAIPAPPQPVTPAPVMTPQSSVPNFNVQTPGKDLWKPTAKARAWKYLVVHHTASERGSVESIHEEHQKKKDANGNAWLGIGYHFLIGNGNGMPDGEIEATFRWRQQLQGAHAGSSDPVYNQQGIGICLVGNFQNHEPSAKQMASLKKLVRSLKGTYRIASKDVIGHRDVRATECPGKLFPMEEVANEPIDFRFSEAMPANSELKVANQIGKHP
ncbi:MAG: peptidoglycan recognition family protein [Planctomycetota bacterium]